ncbi:hypothetical protein, partial [Pseudomonas gessardii]|uniref:hypothetical protein n=1 Tax=Pseudomonas gessardii TaxID=78544 RepID=UPI001F264527
LISWFDASINTLGPLAVAVTCIGDFECSRVEVKKSISALEVEESSVTLETLKPLCFDEKLSISSICI